MTIQESKEYVNKLVFYKKTLYWLKGVNSNGKCRLGILHGQEGDKNVTGVNVSELSILNN